MNDVKKAGVFQRRGRVYMHPYSQTSQGFWIFSEPIAIVKEADQQIAIQLQEILQQSKKNILHPTSWKGLTDPLLKAAGARSFAEFAKNSKAVDVCLEDGLVTFTPTKNGGSGGAFLHLNDKVILRSASSDDLATGLSAAFEACE